MIENDDGGLSCTGNQVSRSALKIARDEGAERFQRNCSEIQESVADLVSATDCLAENSPPARLKLQRARVQP